MDSHETKEYLRRWRLQNTKKVAKLQKAAKFQTLSSFLQLEAVDDLRMEDHVSCTAQAFGFIQDEFDVRSYFYLLTFTFCLQKNQGYSIESKMALLELIWRLHCISLVIHMYIIGRADS